MYGISDCVLRLTAITGICVLTLAKSEIKLQMTGLFKVATTRQPTVSCDIPHSHGHWRYTENNSPSSHILISILGIFTFVLPLFVVVLLLLIASGLLFSLLAS